MSQYQHNPVWSPGAPPPPPEQPKRRRRWPWVVVGVIVALSALSAVASGLDNEPTKRTATPDTTDETITPAGSDPPASPEPEAPAPSNDVAAVGPNEWFTWADGVEAQVTKLEQTNIEYALEPGPHVAATVTVRNGSSAPIDLVMATANLYGGPNGQQAEVDGLYGFEGSVPPGGTATAQWAWAVPAEHMSQLRVEFAPSWEHDPAFFEGSAA